MSALHTMFKRMLVAAAVTAIAGCVGPGKNTPLGTLEDPVYLSPQYRGYRGTVAESAPPATSGQSIQLNRPTPEGPVANSPTVDEFDPLDEFTPEPDSLLSPDVETFDDNVGPLLAPPDITPTAPEATPPPATAKLLLEIDKPERVGVGGDVQYDITIRNDGAAAAEKVEVYCTFDDGLQFPGKVEKELRRNIGRVAGGESQTMSLTLIAGQLGRHCAQFTIKSQGEEVVWKSVCTDVVEQSLSLDVIGPAERTVGSRAEFTMTVSNAGQRVLHGVQAELTYGDTLLPKEATEGAQEGVDRLSWNLGDLQPGETLQLQVEFACQRAADVAKFQMQLRTSDGEVTERETGLQIVPPRGVLELSVSDDEEPLAVDKEFDYTITLHNSGFQDVSGVELKLAPPTGVKLLGVQVTRDGEKIPWPHATKDGQWTFETIDRFAADSTIELQIRAQGLRVGHHKLTAAVQSELDAKAITVEEWTTVNAQ